MTANATVIAFGVVAGSFISLVTFATVTRALGLTSFGNFATALAYLAIPTLVIDAGLSLAVIREIARDPGGAERAIRTSLPLRALISGTVIAASVGLAFVLPFNAPTREAILISAGGSLISLIGGAFVPVLEAELKMAWNVVANLAGRLSTLFVVLALAPLGLGLREVAWSYVFGAAITAVLQLIVVARRMSIRPQVDLTQWRRLLVDGGTLGAATGVGYVYWRIDSVLVALLRDVREVGLYAAAYKFVDLAGALVGGVYSSVFPSLTRFVADGDPRGRVLVQKAFDILLALAVPGAVIALLYGDEIIVLVGGSEFRSGGRAVSILALAPLVSFVGGLFERGLVAAGRERLILSMNVGVLFLNVGLNVALIPSFGYIAAAYTTVASEAAWMVAAAFAFRRTLGFLPSARPLLGTLAGAGAMAVACLLVPGPAIVGAIAGVATFAVSLSAIPGTCQDLMRSAMGSLGIPGRA
jgi:O-antigen/teichoic acid export membrane protein